MVDALRPEGAGSGISNRPRAVGFAAAGVPRDNPQVQKGLDYLLNRQQGFGGWFDPLQSFENFRTPFRETQFAVLALSSYYPGPDKTKGWNSPAPASLSKDPVQLLEQISTGCGTALRPRLVHEIEAATRSNDVLIRQAAAEALGRLAQSGLDRDANLALLGDPSKLVQRSAAWSLRQIYSRHQEAAECAAAYRDVVARRRACDGARRAFSPIISLRSRAAAELITALETLSSDPFIPVRMDAIKGLWQGWFWNADPPFAARSKTPCSPRWPSRSIPGSARI